MTPWGFVAAMSPLSGEHPNRVNCFVDFRQCPPLLGCGCADGRAVFSTPGAMAKSCWGLPGYSRRPHICGIICPGVPEDCPWGHGPMHLVGMPASRMVISGLGGPAPIATKSRGKGVPLAGLRSPAWHPNCSMPHWPWCCCIGPERRPVARGALRAGFPIQRRRCPSSDFGSILSPWVLCGPGGEGGRSGSQAAPRPARLGVGLC